MFLLSSVISAFVQLGLFLVIPFAWWAFTARRSVGFASWIGLRRPTWDGRRARLGVAILAWVVIGAASTALLHSLSGDVPAARFVGRGLGGVVPVLLFAIVQTSLAEVGFRPRQRRSGHRLRYPACRDVRLLRGPDPAPRHRDPDGGQRMDCRLAQRGGGRGIDPARLGASREREPARRNRGGVQPHGVSLVPAGG